MPPSGVHRCHSLSFQNNYGIMPTGKLNKRTIRMMKKPRCGKPDKNKTRRTRSTNGWQKNVITWGVTQLSSHMTKFQQIKIFDRALRIWSKAIPLKFYYVMKDPVINIRFASGDHGDNNPFDGKGNVLAHAFEPGEDHNISGDTHFDESEPWSVSKDSGINLLSVAIHELGHAIGLSHSSDINDVMAPFFDKIHHKLQPNDKRRAQAIYDGSGREYIVSNNLAVPLNQTGNEHTDQVKVYSLSNFCQGIQSHVDAAVYVPNEKKYYFFKDDILWKCDFDNPSSVSKTEVPFHRKHGPPRAAVMIPNWGRKERLFLFGESFYWEWSFWNDNVRTRHRLRISKYWRGVPEGYTKVHPTKRRALKEYPKSVSVSWISNVCW
ncbi:Matrix metalloproteinase-14,Matrix metalloproteinase-15,Matrix metalloproteinase-16,Matrilysin,Matrix metalloproteinase-24 [Mytilus edulis]|uniref:Matrix metalloproteinase-14,Matrix metalloproteinase-15,Matrix metalloproteinase-16,Matrilysin,Matrix metalloproteinase-24 n=1 Tax=Mytilus edulis TaxID=6550 RepID=A0A8S3VEY1_MYTED|nr:Matrix metalloproteinase-14,Matrix metalloproteinase-15,Matrix metalloproteinase-16,Matrilysin,Matrix metalloproteinase-24 [Mytilus edulis]